jgi:hypothetical protein
METSAGAVAGKPTGHSFGFNLAVIAVGVAVAGLALAYGIDAMGRSARVPAPLPGNVTQMLGSTQLNVPAAWFATAELPPSGGFAKQLDLALNLPLGPGGALRKVGVTLTQRSRVRPSATLLDGVYLHQFMAQQLSGPVGLVGKPLSATDGYAGETVWYDPLASSPFVAKCDAPVADSQSGQCLRSVYLGSGIAAIYSFPDDVLGNWKRFDAEMHPLLTEIGAL